MTGAADIRCAIGVIPLVLDALAGLALDLGDR